jgi:glutathione-regulated potassium-efflux system ancillary protein KefG
MEFFVYFSHHSILLIFIIVVKQRKCLSSIHHLKKRMIKSLKILVLIAHPRYENSLVNHSLIEGIKNLPFVTIQDLYEEYPDFDIDIHKEQQLLLEHDIIVWQHPIYWYNCPPLMKQWMDLVLAYGWAYGKNGEQLKGKIIFNCVSAGGSKQVYHHEGRNRFTLNEFLYSFNQTAKLCHMQYLPPFVVHQANIASEGICLSFANEYRTMLTNLYNQETSIHELQAREYLNIHQYH